MKPLHFVALAAAVLLPVAALPTHGQQCAALSEPVEDSMANAPEIGARQNVTGSVSDLDPLRGRVTVESTVGLLELEFPPQALRDFAPGDLVAVRYAVAKPGEESLQGEEVLPLPEYHVVGRISEADYETGWIRVDTDLTTLRLAFPPPAVRELKPGDRVVVTLALSQGS